MPVTQNVTFSATPPTTGENPTTFNYNAISCWDDLKNNIVPALNTAFGQLNELETNVNAKEASAVVAAFAAVAAANFQGTWTDQLTEVGQSWEYSGIIYAVIIAGTASPATTPSNWYALNVRPELVLSNSGFTATLQSGTLSGDVVHTLPKVSDTLAGISNIIGKNLLINANGLVNQRGYASGTATTTANQYTVDRWRVVTSGQNLTFSTTAGVTTFTAPAGGVEQVIENLNVLGGSYVLTIGGTAIALVAESTDNITYTTLTATNGVYTVTGGKYIKIKLSGGTFRLPQFERGVVATPFEQRPYGLELSLCQRYYQRTYSFDATIFWSGNVTSGSWYFASNVFPVPMRVTPSMLILDSSYQLNFDSIALTSGSHTGCRLEARALNTGNGAYVRVIYSASAEL